ncbi:MAG TPA: nitrite reductase large subunit NirB [Kofleriaceae bacterium]|nr:nitrite reductase large subunit NirB [Kofleriaceae bacterium]
MSRLVVIGNGMVSHRFCEKLVEYGLIAHHEIVVFGEEPRPAYDRVHLTEYFGHRSADQLRLGSQAWYAENHIALRVGIRIARIERECRVVVTEAGERIAYDTLVLATGSAPFVPAIPGVDKAGAFVYRTIDDLDAIQGWASRAQRAAVIGGGLLGLEAARALVEVGIDTHVLEVAPRLMPRQLDNAGAALLARSIQRLGVTLHLGTQVTEIGGDDAVRWVQLPDRRLHLDMVIISAGIRPRDELAREAGIVCGDRGGVIVDKHMCTSDRHVFAIGEVALHRGTAYGLVGPGYEMADVLAKRIAGHDAAFTGGDQSAKLKLLGTDVASFGNPFADDPGTRAIAFEDQLRGVYQKLIVTRDGMRLVGGILVGDTSEYGRLLHLTRAKQALNGEVPLFSRGTAPSGELPDDVQVCSCNNVSACTIRERARAGDTIGEIKACTKAGTGCGGCLPLVAELVQVELARSGRATKRVLCQHFAHTRQELFEIVAATQIRTFEELLRAHGTGTGCEICKPTVASILASIHNEPILDEPHRPLQDSNDRYLANIQKNGTYSIVPRMPAGEVTPEQLIALGNVAIKYGLYTKITGGQRVDLFGARVDQLPGIWEELIAAGFESGHAYGKAMRTVKSCVGSTWCRYGVQDSTAFAIRIEHRYKGIRAPHKLKSAVSGCVRECAEAQGKDFGLIATERGWNVYVCGNGGAKPRHADLLASDIDEDTAIRYLDRFLMFYIRTADRLTRTSVWLDKLPGGIEHLRDVVVHDSLGIAGELERQLQHLVDTYECEWAGVVRDSAKRAQFHETRATVRLPVVDHPLGRQFVRVASLRDVPAEGGIAIQYGHAQVAVFRAGGELYATQNSCPHTQASVLARGIVGDDCGAPKVACPLHKRTFDLRSGACLSQDAPPIRTFPIRVDGDDILVELPPPDALAACAGEKALAS